jgi:hypothetical protein
VVARIPQQALDLRVTLAAHDAGAAGHCLEFHLFDVPATALLAPPSGHQRLVCESGMVTLAGRGQVTRRGLVVAGALRVDRLKAHVIGGEPLGGLDPVVWNQALRSIGRLQTTFTVRGSLARPALVLDPLQVAQHVEAELRSVGQHRLAAHVEQCLTGRAPLGEAVANQSGELAGNEWLSNSTGSTAGETTAQTAVNTGTAVDGAVSPADNPALETAPAWTQSCAAPPDAPLAAAAAPTSASADTDQNMPLPAEVASAITSDQPPSVEYLSPAAAAEPNAPGAVGGQADAAAVVIPAAPFVSVRFSPASPQGPGAIDLVTGQDPVDRPAPIAYRQIVEPREPATDWPLDRAEASPSGSFDAVTTPTMQALPTVSDAANVAAAPSNPAADVAASARPGVDSHSSASPASPKPRESLAGDDKPVSWSKKLSNWSRTTLAQAREIAWPFGKEKLPEEPELNGDEWPSDSSWRVGSRMEEKTTGASTPADRTASVERSTSSSRATSSRSSDSRGKRRLR